MYCCVENNPINSVDVNGLCKDKPQWVYDRSTGKIRLVDKDGNVLREAKGYAGMGKGLNNPDFSEKDNNKKTGDYAPLHSGDWTMGPEHDRPSTGVGSIHLDPGTGAEDAEGDEGFYIHGDNKQMNNTASRGCIITDPQTRDAMNTLGSRILKVVDKY